MLYGDYTLEEKERLEVAGVDPDLEMAIRENPQDFETTDIKKVWAYHQGEKDSDNDYEWIVELLDGRIIYLIGWEDYTGWDCQSGLSATSFDSPRQAVAPAKNKEELLLQVNSVKQETWYEKTDKAMGLK